jgi:phenylpropionate dioxygenase-like ring-hydroxylating dioxygenase large terminal subunit
MTPSAEPQPYPRRQWWMAAYSHEVTRALFGTTVLGEKIVLYRTEAGSVVALSGLCPHRMFPLDLSRVVGDTVQCGYHGFRFDPTGRCVEVPSQPEPSPAVLKSYPVIEQGGAVWLWTGEPELADPKRLPDLGAMGLGQAGWGVEHHPRSLLKGRYTLLIDNLLDLSHASFLHEHTIPKAEAVARVPHELIATEQSLNLRRLGCGIPPNPFFKLLFPAHEGSVDQSFDAEYLCPALIRTGGTLYDSASGQPLGTLNFIHAITPETPTSVHYFVMTARNFRTDDPAITALNLKMGQAIQPQDTLAIEAIEAVLSSALPRPVEVSVKADVGAIQVRRRLEAQIRAEAASLAR